MSKLYLVPTPVGNLKDITARALEVLRLVSLVLAEDTRKSGLLLKHYGIKVPMRAYHAFNEHRSSEGICDLIEGGRETALVTNAGTPGISDPGFFLVRMCVARGIDIESLPGPTAFVPALTLSGIPCDRFCFEGFLPHKKGKRAKIEALSNEQRTMVFYESPHRIVKTLDMMSEYFGEEREASVSREITKIHEETVRGTLASLLKHFTDNPPKGELALVVAGHSGKRDKEQPASDCDLPETGKNS